MDLAGLLDRYPGPWKVEQVSDEAFAVVTPAGERLVHFYYRNRPREWRMGQLFCMLEEEARALAEAVAALSQTKTPEA